MAAKYVFSSDLEDKVKEQFVVEHYNGVQTFCDVTGALFEYQHDVGFSCSGVREVVADFVEELAERFNDPIYVYMDFGRFLSFFNEDYCDCEDYPDQCQRLDELMDWYGGLYIHYRHCLITHGNLEKDFGAKIYDDLSRVLDKSELAEFKTVSLNGPIDIEEFNARLQQEKLLKQQEKLLRKNLKSKRKEPKPKRKLITQPTRNLNTVPEELKKKWSQEGIYNSRPDNIREAQKQKVDGDVADWLLLARKFDLNLNDVLFLHFAPVKETFTGIGAKFVSEKLGSPDFSFKTKTQSYDGLWEEQYVAHVYHESHHPESWPNLMAWDSTLECLCDLWACAMRHNTTWIDAYKTFFYWIASVDRGIPTVYEKFKLLNPAAVYYFYTVIRQNDFCSKTFVTPQRVFKLRSQPLSERAKKFDWLKTPKHGDFNKIRLMPEYRNYLADLTLHKSMVDYLMSYFAPYKCDHDRSKMRLESLMAYVYKWHIKPKLAEQTAGPDECPNCTNPFCVNRDPLGSCDVESGFFQGMKEKVMNFAASGYAKVKSVIVDQLPEELRQLGIKLKHQLAELGSVVNGLLDKVKAILKPLSEWLGLDLNVNYLQTALDIVRYYVIWINSTSTVIHALCLYSIASSLGISEVLFDAVKGFFSDFSSETFGVSQDYFDTEAEATSDDGIIGKVKWLFESMLSVDPKVVAVPLSFIILLFFGIRVKGHALSSLGNDFVNSMRNLHFVGAGMLGVTKIFESLLKGIKFCMEWTAQKFFNKMPEDEVEKKRLEALVKRYTDWAVQVNILSADENAPKMLGDKNVQDRIKTLHAEGVALYKLYLAKELPEMASRDFPQVWRQSRMLHNCLLRAMSVQNFRVTPFHVQLFGDAGIGKSTLIQSIVHKIQEKLYPDVTNMTYSQPPTEQCDGYTDQPVWIMDDTQAVNDWKMILQLLIFVSNCPLMTQQSNLEAKATMLRIQWLLSTTNNPYVDIFGMFSQKAWKRRRHFLLRVTCDPRVIDPVDKKFSPALFQKYYPDKDMHHFPHLTFDLMDPLQDRVIDELKLPDGITIPVKGMTYDFMIRQMFAKFAAHATAEKQNFHTENMKYTLLKDQLREFDACYDNFRDENDVWKRMYENNFQDAHKTPPTPPNQEPHPENFDQGGSGTNADPDEEPEEPKVYEDPFEVFQDYCNRGGNVTLLVPPIMEFLTAMLNIEDGFTEDSFFDYFIDYVTMCHVMDSIPSKTHPEYNKLKNLRAKVRKFVSKPSVYNDQDRLMTAEEICNSLVRTAVYNNAKGHVYDNPIVVEKIRAYLDNQKVPLPTELEELIAQHAAQQTATDPMDSYRNFTIPHGLRNKVRCLSKHQSKHDQVEQELNSWCDRHIGHPVSLLVQEERTVINQGTWLEVLRQIKLMYANDGAYRTAYANDDRTHEVYDVRETIATLECLRERLRALHDAIKHERAHRQFLRKKNRPAPESDDEGDKDDFGYQPYVPPPPPKPATQWFGDKNILTPDGYQLRKCLKFGIEVTDRFVPGSIWIEAKDLPVNPFNTFFSHWGNLFLKQSEWNHVSNDPYTDGNVGVSWLFLNGLVRKFDAQTGKTTWFFKTAEKPYCERTVNFYGQIAHFNTYSCLGCSDRFRESYEKWINYDDATRNAIYALWMKHSPLVNWARSRTNAIKIQSKKMFTNMMNHLKGALSVMWQKAKLFKKPLIIGLCAAAVVGACTFFSRLFIPEQTSFRPSSIFSRGGGKNAFSSQSVAKKLLDGVTRVNLEGSTFQGYKIYGKCLLVPYHAVKHIIDNKIRKYWISMDIAPSVKHAFEISHLNIRVFPGCDTVLIYSESFPDWGDRLKFLKNDAEIDQEKEEAAVLVVRNSRGDLETGETPYNGMQKGRTINLNSGISIDMAQIGVLDSFVQIGVSGCPVLVANRNFAPTIMGFQSFRKDGKSYFSVISRETVTAMIDILNIVKFAGPYHVDDTPPSEQTSSILEPHMELVGSLPPKLVCYQPARSEFMRTKLFDAFPQKRVPAVLSEHAPEACGIPAKHSINKHGRDEQRTIPAEFFEQAISELVDYYRVKVQRPKVLSVVTACEGDGTMRHIDLNTSPGIPWVYKRTQSGKKDFIKIGEDGRLSFISPELISSIITYEDHFRRKRVPAFTMMEIVKDELRPISKAYGLSVPEVESLYLRGVSPDKWPKHRNCKTRTITVMPMEYTILYRRYFANFFTQLYKLANTGKEPYCIGINPESTAALNAFMKATSLNTHGFDLDVSNWDGHCSPQLMLGACRVVNAVYNDSAANQNLRTTLVEGALTGFVQFRDMVYRKQWGNPSGFPGTGDFNTLIHILVGFSCWLELMSEAGRTEMCNFEAYLQHVLELYYGDDKLSVPSVSVQDVYNGHTVAAWYTKYGWPTTSASKQHDVGLSPLKELQFLKRIWRVEENDPMYVHWAMDKDTIETLCTYVRRTQEPRQQFYDNLKTALDFATDWGEKYFLHLKNLINQTLVLKRMKPISYTYASMLREKRHRYFDGAQVLDFEDSVFKIEIEDVLLQ